MPVRTSLFAAIAPAIWGTTYVVTTEFMPAERPLLTAAIRVLPIGLLITAWSRRLPTGSWWWRSSVLGVLNFGIFQALLFVAAYRLPGGVAATVGALQPLVVAVLASWLLAERFERRAAIAGLAGIAGVGLLVLTPNTTLDLIGVVAALVATVSMAAGIVLTKRWRRPVDLVTAAGWQLVAGGVLLAVLAAAVEGPAASLTARNWVGAGWLAIVGTGVAYVLWFRGVERIPAATLSFLGLLSPVVATVLGWGLLGQSLSAGQIVGAVLIVATVVVTQVATDPPRRTSDVAESIPPNAKEVVAHAH